MEPREGNRGKVTLVTLGPTGTCHERAAIAYMAFQGVEDFEIELIGDFFDGLERIRASDNAFLIQCSAHPKVHEITERHWAEVFVVDTFSLNGFVNSQSGLPAAAGTNETRQNFNLEIAEQSAVYP